MRGPIPTDDKTGIGEIGMANTKQYRPGMAQFDQYFKIPKTFALSQLPSGHRPFVSR